MDRGLKSAEACRATALLCRQQAAYDPDNSWKLLGEAERWEFLAEQIWASRQNHRMAEDSRSAIGTGTPNAPPSGSKTMAAPQSQALPPKPSRLG
jgi:hypothetical protein